MHRFVFISALLISGFCCNSTASAGSNRPHQQTIYSGGYPNGLKAPANAKLVQVGELADRALQQSQLTLSGSRPFHLAAKIVETTNPNSSYKADLEEDWISPEKWRREIHSPSFSQTIVVNGNAVFEDDKGDYYPVWLKTFITALFDPLPMLDQLKQLDRRIQQPQGGALSTTCLDLHSKIDRSIFCFEGSHGLLESVLVTGYDADFRDYKEFAGKRVARRIETDPESGTHLEAKINELGELSNPAESLFAVTQPTPPENKIVSVRVNEVELRRIALGSTEIHWPTVANGPVTGRCAVYVSVDRAGQPREVWPEGCDNAGLEDFVRDQVAKWRFKPASAHGSLVQLESFVTFTFETKTATAP